MDLTETSVTPSQLGNVLERVHGAGATNICDICYHWEVINMPSLTCGCGEIVNYGEIPCPNEWLFMSDVEFDKLSGLVDVEEIYKAMKSLIKCPRCGMMWFFWNGFQAEPQQYVPQKKWHLSNRGNNELRNEQREKMMG